MCFILKICNRKLNLISILQIDRHCKHASFFLQVLIIIQEENNSDDLSLAKTNLRCSLNSVKDNKTVKNHKKKFGCIKGDAAYFM